MQSRPRNHKTRLYLFSFKSFKVAILYLLVKRKHSIAVKSLKMHHRCHIRKKTLEYATTEKKILYFFFRILKSNTNGKIPVLFSIASLIQLSLLRIFESVTIQTNVHKKKSINNLYRKYSSYYDALLTYYSSRLTKYNSTLWLNFCVKEKYKK